VAAKRGRKIRVLYTFFDRNLPEQAWEPHLCKLPKENQAKVMRYQRWQDRQAAVFGKLLVMEGLKAYGYTANALSRICLDAYGRPRIDDLVDFNLSQSGEYVVCAVSQGVRVGIDIEKRKAFDFSDLATCFSGREMKGLITSENRTAAFYDLWTMKESVLKADGRGLSVPMSQLVINNGHVRLNGVTWFLKELDFGLDYSCHLAIDHEVSTIQMKKVDFDQKPEACRAGRLGPCPHAGDWDARDDEPEVGYDLT
jgi:4'-phosphopantetheinyl transferase